MSSYAAGKVYLVGAGPGDPGLITVKGLRCLQTADVLLYDRLASPQLVQAAPPQAELIFCGKRPGYQELAQEQINALLVAKAREGKVVCRLKGGDPFIFGRGGEEALALRQAGIPFEIVPGVSSAVAAPAYAGIPLTHRGTAASFAVVTGHEDPTKPETQVRWERLAAAVDTLVILMGVGNLDAIVAGLRAGGRPADTPVAIISRGTTNEQSTLTSTLEQVVAAAAAAGVQPPAAIVIGDVVELRERLGWFDSRPLFGRTGLVTRARPQASELSALLREQGASPVELPAIEIAAPDHWGPLEAAFSRSGDYGWLIFSSVNAVTAVQEYLAAGGRDVRVLRGPRVAAVGAKTAAAARAAGLHVDLCPETYVAEALLAALRERDEELRGSRVLLLGAAEGRPVLPHGLRAAGAVVDQVTVYRTVPAETVDPEILGLLEQGRIDFVTFASSSSVRGLMTILGPGAAEILSGVTVACIGPVTAETAREYGLTVAVVPEEATVEALVAGLARFYCGS